MASPDRKLKVKRKARKAVQAGGLLPPRPPRLPRVAQERLQQQSEYSAPKAPCQGSGVWHLQVTFSLAPNLLLASPSVLPAEPTLHFLTLLTLDQEPVPGQISPLPPLPPAGPPGERSRRTQTEEPASFPLALALGWWAASGMEAVQLRASANHTIATTLTAFPRPLGA